jgi:hypothetical protein
MSSFPTGTGDAVAARARTQLANFTNWLAANNVKGIVGEFGWPQSSNPGADPLGSGAKFDPRWDAVAQQWYLDANAAGLHTTNWVASEWGIDLRSYRTADGNNGPLTHRTTVSSVLEQNYSAVNGVLRGVNLAGAEYSDFGPEGALNLSTTTQPGAGYYYPSGSTWTDLYSRGVRLVRYPVRWERLQTTLKGPLNHDISLLVASINEAAAAGIVCLIDLHNYGRYDTAATENTTGNTNGVRKLGDSAPNGISGTMTECFVDFWQRMATLFKDNVGVWGYGLCNEPQGITGGVATWLTATQEATEAIRRIDQTTFISVGGYFYSTVPGWVDQNGTSAWLTELIPSGQLNAGQPRNRDPYIVFEGHHYWDSTNAGQYVLSYDEELTNAQNQGFTSYSNAGYTAQPTFNTLQTGDRVSFKTSFDSPSDFSGAFDAITVGSNTVTLPYAPIGNPGNSLKVSSTALSDAGGVQKSLTTSVFRSFSLDIYIPSNASLSQTDSVAIAHVWRNDNSTDLIELRVVGSGSGYKLGLTVPSGAYTFINTGETIVTKGSWHTAQVTVTNTAITLNVDAGSNVEASVSGALTGVSAGGIFIGKFYGTSYVGDMYFDNFVASNAATYYAPPNGGLMRSTVAPVLNKTHGLMHFF